VFTAIEDHVARNPDLVSKVGKVFVFKLTSPDSAWTIDVKNGSGSVKAGAVAADTTLELSNEDFLAMTSGKADAMKLYMGGKLKITGDVMASQKLGFLQKMDPQKGLDAVMKKRGAGGATAAAVSAPKETGAVNGVAAATAPTIFKRLGERLGKSGSLAREVSTVIQFDVMKPETSWTVNLTGAGAVHEGADAEATTVLRIDDVDLAALCRSSDLQEAARDLYQHGKLRVDGDMRPAQKLTFLKDLS
jgi:3-hydroxyacyl-CoA dehydrogenase/3a,7a,12a-trihydroxy-5b-cholest-24-enoyl-CoA hydratase